MQAKPQDAAELDFRVAMRIAKEQPVVFSVGSSQAGRIPASVRELAIMLEIAPGDRSFSFRQVMNLVLQRGIVLTETGGCPFSAASPCQNSAARLTCATARRWAGRSSA
jgi:hypothetical protein